MAYYRFNRARRYQAGGAAPEAGGDPMQQIIQAAIQAVQSNDTQLAMQVCQVLVQLAQGGGGEEAAPQEAPEGGEAPESGEPVYRRGGRLLYRTPRW